MKKEYTYYCELCVEEFLIKPPNHLPKSKKHKERAESYPLEEPIQRIPPGGIDYFEKGVAHSSFKKGEKITKERVIIAIEWFAKAIEKVGQPPQTIALALLHKGKLEMKINKVEEACKTFNKLKECPGWEGMGFYYLGRISFKETKLKNLKTGPKKFTEAKEYYLKALHTLPSNLQLEKERVPSNAKAFEKSLIATYLKLSEILFLEKDRKQALKNGEEALKLIETSPSQSLKMKARNQVQRCCQKLGYTFEKYVIKDSADFKDEYVKSANYVSRNPFPDIKYTGPYVSLAKSILQTKSIANTKNLMDCIEHAEKSVKQFHKNNPQLTKEECCAIFLYTRHDIKLYEALNKALTCQEDRKTTIEVWKPYLNYLLSGLSKLKPIDAKKLYRGVKEDLLFVNREKYSKGEEITFYSFTSTSIKRDVAVNFMDKGKGTLFVFEGLEERRNYSGRFLDKELSFFLDREQEVLFPPGATFRISKIEEHHKYSQIHLIELPSILPFIFDNRVKEEMTSPGTSGKNKRKTSPGKDNKEPKKPRKDPGTDSSLPSLSLRNSKEGLQAIQTTQGTYHPTSTQPSINNPTEDPFHYKNTPNQPYSDNLRKAYPHKPPITNSHYPTKSPLLAQPLTLDLMGEWVGGQTYLTEPNITTLNQPKANTYKTALLYILSICGLIWLFRFYTKQ
eukprot:TRINITY_DN11791_c0_g1_i1.p1 TRINITY_DN11791_c0_g1~~TRINITY_DN11791_c0_g1_i1.p1  ORF type:complete len:678 (+),score=176.47 TRINITY_DN11791_c0_g1_i1:76-2109(+)